MSVSHSTSPRAAAQLAPLLKGEGKKGAAQCVNLVARQGEDFRRADAATSLIFSAFAIDRQKIDEPRSPIRLRALPSLQGTELIE